MTEIPKNYDPSDIEKKWYSFWEENGFFHSEPDGREPYTIVIPPPNVTGILHMGHILNNTIQDVLVRKARMEGKNACWVPGTDHASIATEAKVVQRLRKKGIKKSDLSREDFLKHAWDWTEEHGGIILKQLKTLGASCDWQRTRFTLEDDLYDSVIDCFIRLFDDGYIYRGKRMINWDPEAKTALSDEEVIHREVQSKLYHVRYPVKGEENTYVTIATTRPETILADTAVCVHPDDERYTDIVGKTVIVPIEGREVPIIADDYVDPEFGTGCLKITPAHDTNDYEIGTKHGLEIIDMLNSDGTVSDAVSNYNGMDRFEARKAIVKDLEAEDFLVKTEDLINKVGYSERTDCVIEPRLSLQWFLKMDELSKPALENVMNNEVQFHPEKFKNSYRHWMENVRDWCISRQLWWGHRIPAWYYGEGADEFVIARTKDEALEKASAKADRTISADELNQDEDVLDTWFSSWLWPITVFDGMDNPENDDINYYYPTNDLVTAPEIMFFWVARMIIAGYYFRDEKPFKNVYYTGIVRDDKRRKMSKSLGNSPDALNLIEQHGADGVRVGMLFSSPAGNDLLYDESLVEQGRNFANKIWNAFRFLSMNMEEGVTYDTSEHIEPQNLADEWMLSRIQHVMAEMREKFDQFRINEALKEIYSLVWDDFCDWYIELSKSGKPGENMSKDQLTRALSMFEQLMKLLHPFMPFISEEIWQRIKDRSTEEALIQTQWPLVKKDQYQPEKEQLFGVIKKLVSGIRNIRAEMNISPKEPLTVFIKTESKELAEQLISSEWVLKKLETIEELTIGTDIEKPQAAASAVISGNELIIPLKGLIDLDKEREKIEKEIQRLEGFLKGIEKKLSNSKFVDNAPQDVVERERKKQSDTLSTLEKLKNNLADFLS
jgi:valyl-tRNA synthetase